MKLFNRLKVLLVTAGLVLSLNLSAQEDYRPVDVDEADTRIEMADVMRSNGKIYVVVGIILIIFGGITYYTIRLDKKITKLEKGE
ncbi:MAG: CcmD family protein [Bacteroidota bacterium]